MQKKITLFLAAGAAAILGLGGIAGLASADMGRKGHGMGRGHGGMQMMERYDANKDGKLSQEEIDTNRASWHGEFDGDKNASLSLDEFRNLWLKARNEEMVREFQRFDRDGNGQVTLDEYQQPMTGMVANMDQNGDGVLSQDDRQHRRGKKHGDRMEQGQPPEAPATGEGQQ